MTSVFGPPPAGQFQIEFARAWLHGHGIHAQPTWFIAMRLAGQGPLRYENFTNRHPIMLGVFAAVWTAALSLHMTLAPDHDPAWYTIPLYGFFFAIRVWFNYEQVLGERRLAARLPRRVASPVAPKWTDFLNGPRACALVLSYVGGLGLAASMIALGEVLAGGLLAVAVLLAGCVSAWLTRRALNRPALAEDALSLLVDDRLRAEEVRSAMFPLVAYAFIIPANFTDRVAFQLTFLGLLIASMVCWQVGGRTRKRRVGAP